ncbi:DUF2442 domain-containing protein [Caballeronia grimmiae]|uniref:DUF2442 domain-containing protein n=1 Tax=Caballeronia grimmiae TaxID=1071679 RepID=UPI0038B70579
MALTEEQIDAARDRGENVGPCAVSARYILSSGRLEVDFDNGVMVAVPTRLIQGLANASPVDMQTIEISPTGWSLRCPTIDLDVYAPSLFAGIYGSIVRVEHLGAKRSALGSQGGNGAREAKEGQSPAQ